MPIFDPLYIGISGLEAYQEQINILSNNIANVGSTGYKAQEVSFQDLLYRTQVTASAPTATTGGTNGQDIGDGVKIASVDTNFSQGGLQTTGINTDIAINGDGFFVLNDTLGQQAPRFTRDGHFGLNQSGLLYDPTSGLAVLGYPRQQNGAINQQVPPGPIQVPLNLKSQAVATGTGAKLGPTNDQQYDISFGGNLDQSQYAAAVSNPALGVTMTTISTTVYDSLGSAHLVKITFQPEGPAAGGALLTTVGGFLVSTPQGALVTAATEWSYTITPTDGSDFGAGAGTAVVGGYMFYDQNGQFINTSATSAVSSPHTQGNAATTANGNQLKVVSWNGPGGGNNATTYPLAGGPIGIDFSTMTSLAGQVTVNTVAQNGFAPGILSNLSFSPDGTILGAFTNGQNIALGKLAIANFTNENGLTRVGSDQFETTAASGVPQYSFAQTGRAGSLVGGSLEQSNVSIADEFTKMILAQRSFEANSRSITTADQDLQTVIGLKR